MNDFTNEFKCSNVHIFEIINVLSINIFELSFYQDQKKWKHNLIPIENSILLKINQIELLTFFYTKISMHSLKI